MKGLTALEIIVSVAILGVVSAMLVSVFSGFRSAGYMVDTETHIIGIFRDARSKTLGSKDNVTYGVHFETTKVELFSGSTYGVPGTTVETYMLPVGVRISNIALANGGSNIIFARLTGTPSTSGTITFQLQNNPANAKMITILATGAIY